jgi:hypothetical protein
MFINKKFLNVQASYENNLLNSLCSKGYGLCLSEVVFVLQILQSLIAQSVLSGRLKSVEPETWGSGIEHLGKFVYVLPVSALESYRLSPPTALVQSIIDSDKITTRQVRS